MSTDLPLLRSWLYVQHGEKSCCCFSTAIWRKRFCVLQYGKIFIYTDDQSVNAIDSISLYGADVEALSDNSAPKPNAFVVTGKDSTLNFATPSIEDMKKWCIQIQRAAIVVSGGSLAVDGSLSFENYAGKSAPSVPSTPNKASVNAAARVASGTEYSHFDD